MRQLWQRSMIALARSPRVKTFMQNTRGGTYLAGQFVAGRKSADGINRALAMKAQGLMGSSFFYLGEYVDTRERVDENLENILHVTKALAATELDVHISVDPSQIGYHVDFDMARRNLRMIAEAIQVAAGDRPGVHCLMFDMEDESVVDRTIALHDELQDAGFPVALTLQAYLHRSMSDLERQIRRGSRVRLVRGAFAAGSEIALTEMVKIKANYRKMVEAMLSTDAKTCRFYPIFATYDTALHDHAISLARRNGWRQGEYEFEVLLGVCEDISSALVQAGEAVRVYIPFGEDWWPHAVRRIGENPSNAKLLLRSLMQKGA